MKNKKFVAMVFILGVAFFLMFFIPIPTDKMYGDSPMCWYRFGVYNYEYDDETGSNIDFGGSIYLGRKIGGIQEYFLLKKIKEK